MNDDTYTPSESVICIGGVNQAKAAAIYFDFVLPLTFGRCPPEILLPDYFENQEFQEAITMIDLVAMQYVPNKGNFGALPINQAPVRVTKGDKVGLFKPRHIELSEEEQEEADLLITTTYIDSDSEFRKYLSHFLSQYLKGMPLVTPASPLESSTATTDDISVVMSGIPIVEVDKASWEQIVEFRKDPQAKAKLRRFRLFAHDKFKDKSRTYIEDTLNSMIEDYQAAAKDHGFELLTGSLTTLANSKALMTTGAAALVASIMGSPITAGVAALAGVSLEIANIALKVAEKRHAFHKLQRDHQLAYILEAKRRLS